MITLSNGTKIERVQQGSGCIKAVVLPDDREMTDEEWDEYTLIVRQSNKFHHEYASLMRYCAMRQNPFKYYIPDDLPTLEAMQARMKEIEQWYEKYEA